uniref:Ribosomal protein S10 n=1 Tax=Protohalopteris sp. TaxID=2843287 RepID=A0A8F0FD74_9PHAE|nr:ribosomal protein S10 [Protohalopteris sp.]
MQKKNFNSNNQVYLCNIWVQSTSLKSLKLWVRSLPMYPVCFGLPLKIKRFTVFRSPLGNKTAKDQYEKREYCFFLSISSKNAPRILAFLEVSQQVIHVKIKSSTSSTSLVGKNMF